VLLLATSIIISIWMIVGTLQFELTVGAQTYLHLPETVGISYTCEHFIPSTVGKVPVPNYLSLVDLTSLLAPSGKPTAAYDTTIFHNYT
jgi:hypothetical protein